MILFPEGAIKLQSTGRQVLERCDGKRTFGEIIAEIQKEFGTTDPHKIRARYKHVPGTTAASTHRGLLMIH